MIKYQSHEYDFVSRVLGGNPATGGTIPENSNRLKEWVKIMRPKKTTHNSYATTQGSLRDTDFQDKINMYWGGETPQLVPVNQ